MKRLFRLLSLFVMSAACSGAWAQTTPRSVPPNHAEHMLAMDHKMKAMREMHEKMAKAKTLEERSALMAEHMKTMHEGMDMMHGPQGMAGMGGMHGAAGMHGGMHGGMHAPPPAAGASGPRPGTTKHHSMRQRHEMMEKRMDMMHMMMQMMMDRMPAK